jgi:pilus assembly protein Flp/PilA
LLEKYPPGINCEEVRGMFISLKEQGQGMVEYALILVLVAIVVIASLMLLGPIVANVFSTLNNSFPSFT